MILRWARPSDYNALGEIMFDAVRNGPSLYNEAQRRAWVVTPRSGAEWNARLGRQHVVVADEDGELQGFMSLVPDGYIDFAYIRPNHQRTGMFRRLFEAIEKKAGDIGVSRLWTHASLMAHPAFGAMGFEVVRLETVELGGEEFQRYEMEKRP